AATVRGGSRGACAAIAATERVVGDGGEAGAAGWDHRNGAGAGRGPAESSEMGGSIRASRFHKVAEGPAPASAGRECRARLRGTAGGEHGNGNQLCGGSRIIQRRKAAAGSESHRYQPTGRADSRVRSVVGHAGHHAADADSGGGGGGRFRKGIDSLAELCRAKLHADPFSGSVFVF